MCRLRVWNQQIQNEGTRQKIEEISIRKAKEKDGKNNGYQSKKRRLRPRRRSRPWWFGNQNHIDWKALEKN